MALYIGTILLWLAAVSRTVASVRRPDPARISMTAATICIAIAFTLSREITGAGFDDLLNWPNGAELVQHLFFATATFATLRFILPSSARFTAGSDGTACRRPCASRSAGR